MSELIEDLKLERRRPAPSLAKAIRISAGATGAAVAAELGVHRVTLARWENGSRRPRGEHLRRYLELLDELTQVSA